MGHFKQPVLVVGRKNELIAQQIVGTKYDPYTANNTINVSAGMTYKVLNNLPPAFDNYYWLVDMARMSGAEKGMKTGVIRPYLWNDRIKYDDTSGLSYGVPSKWLAASIDRFMVFDWSWVVMCPATTSIRPSF
jgi:hypothetical protein